jgi:hypothetical protein
VVAVPYPCRGDSVVDVHETGRPVEFPPGLGAVRIKRGRIAFAAGPDFVRDLETADLLDAADDLANADGGAGAEVVVEKGARFVQFGKNGDVGTRKVIDVNIVAKAGPVGGIIIVPENSG